MPRDAEDMALYNPLQFFQEVRQEVSKVTWPSRKEVWVTTVAVLIMVALAALFFLLVDQAIGWLVSLILGFGR
jgi:preprotein translocase subunit SecE